MRISDWNSDVCSSDLAIDIGKISLDGLSSEDVQDKLNAVFSALGDTFAATVLPGISDFQRTGEGLYETLIRVASETSAVQHVFDAMGVAAGDLDGLDLARVADNIIQLSGGRSEEHTSELKSLMRISYAVLCLKKKKK